MTDNEIIKALEICSHRNGDLPCEGCPVNIVQMCIEDLMSEALDLINRQKTEYERLLQKLQQAKSDAIEEFAERLKVEIICDTAYGCDCNQHSGYYDYKIKIGDISEYIDDIVKKN